MTNTGSTTTVPMPALGDAITEATVTRWLKQPGDAVAFDEPLFEVATDKVDTEIASPVEGVLTEILASEDDVIEIGAPVAVITSTQAGPAPEAEPVTPGEAVPVPAPVAPAPAARVEAAPVEAVPAEVPAPTAEAGETGGDRVEKLPRIRRTIAARMVESLRIAAQLTTVVEVNVSAIARLRREHKATFVRRTGHKLSYLPFFAKAAVEALSDNPVINSSLDADVTTVTYHRACHLGMAVEGPKGLMVPVLQDAQNLTIAGLTQGIADVAARVRNGTIDPGELSGGTFTITNTGSRGALFDTPIINQPQSAILGTGTVVERLIPAYDAAGNLTISVVPMVYLAISYDHRIIDGADAARYLSSVKVRLEQGYTEADLF
jgi:2-oxoglutarate dehydrogenase E2 component (dihydrolipoamide succinyltransferase)